MEFSETTLEKIDKRSKSFFHENKINHHTNSDTNIIMIALVSCTGSCNSKSSYFPFI